MKVEFTEGANRLPEVSQGRPLVEFFLTCGIAENEIVRFESYANTWRDDACQSATVGLA